MAIKKFSEVFLAPFAAMSYPFTGGLARQKEWRSTAAAQRNNQPGLHPDLLDAALQAE